MGALSGFAKRARRSIIPAGCFLGNVKPCHVLAGVRMHLLIAGFGNAVGPDVCCNSRPAPNAHTTMWRRGACTFVLHPTLGEAVLCRDHVSISWHCSRVSQLALSATLLDATLPCEEPASTHAERACLSDRYSAAICLCSCCTVVIYEHLARYAQSCQLEQGPAYQAERPAVPLLARLAAWCVAAASVTLVPALNRGA